MSVEVLYVFFNWLLVHNKFPLRDKKGFDWLTMFEAFDHLYDDYNNPDYNSEQTDEGESVDEVWPSLNPHLKDLKISSEPRVQCPMLKI